MTIKDFFTKTITATEHWKEVTKTVLRIDRIIVCGIALLLAFLLLTSCFTIIGAGHTGVVSTFGRVSEDVLQEGPHFKLPWQKVTKMDNRIVKMEVGTEAFSSDLQTVTVNLAVNYRVDPTKSYYILKNVGKKYEDVLITPAVHEVMKAIVANYTAEKSIASRSEISAALLDDLNTKMNQSGIYVSDINILDFDFSDAYISAIESKQVAEQQRLQAQIEQERLTMEKQAESDRKVIAAQASAETARIEAEAAAEVTRIEADAAAYAGKIEAETNEKIAASLTDTLVDYFKIEQWDGKLPGITGADSIITMTE